MHFSLLGNIIFYIVFDHVFLMLAISLFFICRIALFPNKVTNDTVFPVVFQSEMIVSILCMISLFPFDTTFMFSTRVWHHYLSNVNTLTMTSYLDT